VTWTTRTIETAAAAGLGAALVAALLVVDDAPGRLLLGVAAALLLALAARDVLQRPRLAAGPDGIRVRRLVGGLHLPWARVQVRVRETRRLGMRTVTLELDTAAGPEDDDGVLIVLGRRDLGADPAAVARRLHELDPTG
jgi:hypothetical protein